MPLSMKVHCSDATRSLITVKISHVIIGRKGCKESLLVFV